MGHWPGGRNRLKMRNPKWMTPQDVAEVVSAALMASAAACTVNHKETEVFLRHVATFIGVTGGGTSERAAEALARTAQILRSCEPPPPLCDGDQMVNMH